MNDDYPTKELEKKVIERFNSIDFHCIFCDNPDSLAKSIIEYMSPFSDYSTAVTVTAFLICPQCKNKFFVKIRSRENKLKIFFKEVSPYVFLDFVE